MEGLLLIPAAVLVVAACCGLPILLLGAAALFNRNKNQLEERPTLGQIAGQEEGNGEAGY